MLTLPETESKALLLFKDEAGETQLWLRFVDLNGFVRWFNEQKRIWADEDQSDLLERRLAVVRKGEANMRNIVYSLNKRR